MADRHPLITEFHQRLDALDARRRRRVLMMDLALAAGWIIFCIGFGAAFWWVSI